MLQKGLFSSIKYDLPASLVVFLVAVPLCLGIALASGAPLYSGMIAGIVGGLVVGSISNSQVSVSGPAAGLAAIVLVSINELGSFEIFLLAVMIGGLLQVLLGLAKAGSVANYFPSSVIKGMLTGIGIIIIMKQIPHALGDDQDAEGDFAFQQMDGENSLTELWVAITQFVNPGALIVAIVALAIILLWEKPFIKNRIKSIPGALVAVFSGIFINFLYQKFTPDFVLTGNHLVKIPVASSFNEFLGQFMTPDFSQIANPDVWKIGFTVAVVASIESLLCIEATDKLDPFKRHTNYNRELLAQGIGNITSGLIGGLPVTSVVVRSSANIDSGGRTKLSALLHGALLLVCVAFIPNILNMIPLAALAAVLLVVGYKLAKPALFKSMYEKGIYQFVPFVVTVLAVVFTDLLTGVGVGLMTSIFAILFGNLRNSYHFHKESYQEGDIVTIELAQEVSFLNKASIKNTLDSLPEGAHVVLDATKSAYIDNDVLELIREFQTVKAGQKNINAVFKGFKNIYNIDNTHLVHSDPADRKDITKKLLGEAS